jgi:hypothetical protein
MEHTRHFGGFRGLVLLAFAMLVFSGFGNAVAAQESSPSASPAAESTTAPTGTQSACVTASASPVASPTESAPPASPGAPLTSSSGKGDKILNIDPQDVPTVASFTHKGKRNFSVKSFIGTDNDDLLINTIGAYKGDVWVNAGVTRFQITADGPWTVSIKLVTDATAWDGSAPLSAKGDAVLMLAGAASKAMAIEAKGKDNFAVLAKSPEGDYLDLLVNEIGNYSGEVLLPDADPIVLEIHGDGEVWTLSPPQG